MLNRRVVIGLMASAGTLIASGVSFAKDKKHLNGQALLGDKIKQNGRHKIHTAGKSDVFADVMNGKVIGLTATGMQVKKVKSREKMADMTTDVTLASMHLAQTDTYYYGYWVYDPVLDYYYWFPADYVVVDMTWAPYP